MLNIEKSDHIICNKKASQTFQHKKYNDKLFFQQMGNVQPTMLKNVAREHELLKASQNPRLYTCTEDIMSRGGNAEVCEGTDICQGYKCYTQYHLNEYLLIPCKTNTFRNHIECDNDKCCSVHHQMFMNLTKRI
jgi:hypothetical protein